MSVTLSEVPADLKRFFKPKPKRCGVCYVCHMVEIFREVRRVLRPDGTLWLNLGDTYWGGGSTTRRSQDPDNFAESSTLTSAHSGGMGRPVKPQRHETLKPKDLVGVPWRVALALQDDGWWLRNDIIWSKCLGGTTRVYARTPAGDGPRMIKDLFRTCRPEQVQLWTGEKWSKVVAWEKTPPRPTVRLDFRCGDRIYCSPEHRWPTTNSIKAAADLVVGDVVSSTRLPEPDAPATPVGLPDADIGWFVGLYLAEGSRSGDVLQFAGHRKEVDRHVRLKWIAEAYHGTCNRHPGNGEGCTDNIHNHVLNGVVHLYVGGRTAYTKFLTKKVWRRSDGFLQALLEGYLEGDGHWDEANKRWRLGFCRNRTMERQIRTLVARLGHHLKLVPSHATYTDSKTRKRKKVEAYRGEIRFERSGHHNEKESWEVVGVATSTRSRALYDIQIEDEPHLFALASGVLTHNSNRLPHPVKDRMTSSHEHIFLLTKARRYFFNLDAIRMPHTYGEYGEDGDFEPAQRWLSEDPSRTDRKLDQTQGQLGTQAGPPRRFGRAIYNAKGKNPGDVASWPEKSINLPPLSRETHTAILGPKEFRNVAAFTFRVVDELVDSPSRVWLHRSGADAAVLDEAVANAVEEFRCTRPHQPHLSLVRGHPYTPITIEHSPDEIAIEFGRNRWVFRRESLSGDDPERGQIVRHRFAVDGQGMASPLVLVNWMCGLPLSTGELNDLLVLRREAYRDLLAITPPTHDTTVSDEEAEEIRHLRAPGAEIVLAECMLAVAVHASRVAVTSPSLVVLRAEAPRSLFAGAVGDRTFHFPVLPLTRTIGKPLGDVWVFPTQPFPGAHFAVFPPALPERCILAGTSDKGVCPSCSTPWHLVKEYGEREDIAASSGMVSDISGAPHRAQRGKDPSKKGGSVLSSRPVLSEEWRPACECGVEEAVRSTVLDPFSGSGTTGMVALELGHDYIGIDLNDSYLDMASARVRGEKPPEEPPPIEEGSVLDLFGIG